MGTLQEEIAFFKTVYPKLKKNVTTTLDNKTKTLRDQIANKVPYVTGTYSRAWRVNKTRGSGADTIANSQIFNVLPQAGPLEYGVDFADFPNHPWVVGYIAGTAPEVDVQDGSVWSKKAMGGTMLKYFSPVFKDKLHKAIADSAIEAFK